MLHFRKNEFISLYNFLPWYALANVLLIVGGIKVFSFSIRELFDSLKDMCDFISQEIRGLLLIWMVATVSFAIIAIIIIIHCHCTIAIITIAIAILISLQPLSLPMFANVCQVITLIWEFTLLSILFSYDTTFGFVLTFALLQVDFFFFSEQLSYT